MKMTTLSVLAAMTLFFGRSSQMSQPIDGHAREAVTRFVAALDALDAEAFVDCFTADATIFYPQSSQPHRVKGRDEIRSSIQLEFDSARKRLASMGRTAPPFLNIEPLDVHVQIVGSQVAVVTWHVDRKTHGGRRTAVVVKRGDDWKIASLHSSNMPYPGAASLGGDRRHAQRSHN